MTGQGQRPGWCCHAKLRRGLHGACCAASAIAVVRREWGFSNPRMDRVILASMATELARGWMLGGAARPERGLRERIAERMNVRIAERSSVEAAGNRE